MVEDDVSALAFEALAPEAAVSPPKSLDESSHWSKRRKRAPPKGIEHLDPLRKVCSRSLVPLSTASSESPAQCVGAANKTNRRAGHLLRLMLSGEEAPALRGLAMKLCVEVQEVVPVTADRRTQKQLAARAHATRRAPTAAW